jgi:hypothetical protein
MLALIAVIIGLSAGVYGVSSARASSNTPYASGLDPEICVQATKVSALQKNGKRTIILEAAGYSRTIERVNRRPSISVGRYYWVLSDGRTGRIIEIYQDKGCPATKPGIIKKN